VVDGLRGAVRPVAVDARLSGRALPRVPRAYEKQEAAGFGIRWARGSTPGHVEADLLYFAGDKHDVTAGEPLVLVECKRLIKDENELQAAGS
jgi:hypothetical protein